ncbi:MAG: hypothetical protein ABEH56_00360 [Salinirussus sp.]
MLDADDAVERMVADGFPRNGIQAVHEHTQSRVTGSRDAGDSGNRKSI